MLGLKKTDRYWLVHKNYFRTETLLGKMRVEIASFEKWYANQDWYHSQSRYRTQEDRKKDAAAEAASLSMPEMARLLDVPRSTVYGILNNKKYALLLDVIVIAGRRRVTRESFERFLQAQNTYELFNFGYEDLELEEKREYENYKRSGISWRRIQHLKRRYQSINQRNGQYGMQRPLHMLWMCVKMSA